MENIFSGLNNEKRPMAFRLRPEKLSEFIGQEGIISEGKMLRKMISAKRMVNCIFFGPPGTGKTTLAEIISKELHFDFISKNAVDTSVTEIKEIAKKAKNKLKINSVQTILFLDEIHRFNKLQQDVLLPFTEDGTIILIGATTENPYYSLNNSLLSRCLVFEFKKISSDGIAKLIERACEEEEDLKGLDKEIIEVIIALVDGDARRAINYLELIRNTGTNITPEEFKDATGTSKLVYDKEEDKYNTISALIKSIRGSAPDAAVYWLGKMLAGGEDPVYIARRLMILAAEDIGLANPEALSVAAAAITAAQNIGMPEVRIILSEVVIYLAISSKSNSAYEAINSVMKDIDEGKIYLVPEHLKNKPNSGYIYPHSCKDNFVKQRYINESVKYYNPSNNKNENFIREKLKKLWEE